MRGIDTLTSRQPGSRPTVMLCAAVLCVAASLVACPSDSPNAPSLNTDSGLPPTTASGLRACDVLLDVGDAETSTVTYDNNARGAHFRRGKRMGVAVISRGDFELPTPAVRVQLSAGQLANVVTTTCYDRLGQPVADGGAGVTLSLASLDGGAP